MLQQCDDRIEINSEYAPTGFFPCAGRWTEEGRPRGWTHQLGRLEEWLGRRWWWHTNDNHPFQLTVDLQIATTSVRTRLIIIEYKRVHLFTIIYTYILRIRQFSIPTSIWPAYLHTLHSQIVEIIYICCGPTTTRTGLANDPRASELELGRIRF